MKVKREKKSIKRKRERGEESQIEKVKREREYEEKKRERQHSFIHLLIFFYSIIFFYSAPTRSRRYLRWSYWLLGGGA